MGWHFFSVMPVKVVLLVGVELACIKRLALQGVTCSAFKARSLAFKASVISFPVSCAKVPRYLRTG